MAYTTFERSVKRENLMIANQQYAIKNYIKETEGYIKKDNAKDIILRTRQIFKEALIKNKGPPIIPTVFRNNPKRYEWVRARDWALQSVRSAQKPPELPFYLFTFGDEIFLNLTYNLRPNACRAYINHGVKTRFIFMNKESCGEMAFEEMLSQKPFFYSEDEEILKRSRHIDLEITKDLKHHDIPDKEFCCDTGYFIVDFSIIFPEVKVSTVWVYCRVCGGLLETVLFDKTIQVVQEEIFFNISQAKVEQSEKDSDSACLVIRLPIRSVNIQGCSLVEGLLGVTPLTKGNPVTPSVFVRTRLFYFCNQNSRIGEVVHQTQDKDITHLEI